MRKYSIIKPQIISLLYCLIMSSSFLLAQPDKLILNNLDALQSWVAEHVEIYEDSTLSYQYAHLALKKAQATEDIGQIAMAFENLTTWYSYNYAICACDSAIHYGLKTLDLYKQAEDTTKVAQTYSYLALDYAANGHFHKAEQMTFKAIEVYEQQRDYPNLADGFITLSGNYIDTEDTVKAVFYANKGIELAKSHGLKTELPNLYLGSMHAHLLSGDYEKVLEQSEEAIRLFEEQGIVEDNAYYKAHNRRGDVYLATGQYDKALKDYQLAYNGALKLYGQNHANGYADNIGRVYQQQGLYELALPYFENGYKYATQFAVPYKLERRHQELADCYENMGFFEQALYHTLEANKLDKSKLKNKMENIQSALLLQYETVKKDKMISNQTAMIAQQQQIQYLSYGIWGMLIICLGGLIWGYRKNQHKNSQLQILNDDLATKNDQNELLLKEIHHRVKNNLELVKSLLSLQSAQIDDPKVQAAIQSSQNRVQSMGIIHQKLYQGKNLAEIEMKDYFLNLGEGILDSFAVDDRIQIECVMEELELDIDTAIPIGLIVNELLTNALKYAFPAGQKGKIEIELSQNEEILQLKVKDNGIGKITTNAPSGTGFGTQLVSLLTMQLDGTMEEKIENGTIVSFQFKKSVAA